MVPKALEVRARERAAVSQMLVVAQRVLFLFLAAGVGLSVSQDTIDYSLELAERYGLDTAVYFMNLNDIVPDATVATQQQNAVVKEAPWTRHALVWLSRHADWLHKDPDA